MVLLGVDPHKDTHTVVAVDQVGRQLDQTTVTARTQGHTELLGWATRRWADDRLWALEDCRHVTGRLERDLLAAGEQVVRVPTRRPGRSSCWSITASTSSPSALGRSTGSAGTCTSSTPSSSTPPNGCQAHRWTACPLARRRPGIGPGRHLPGAHRHAIRALTTRIDQLARDLRTRVMRLARTC
jgi:hypothetical protein